MIAHSSRPLPPAGRVGYAVRMGRARAKTTGKKKGRASKRSGTSSRAPEAELPAALAQRAAALSANKRRRLAARGAELAALVRRRREEIADAFYDIGEALAELKSRDMIAALGLRTFAELCESRLGISVALAQQLVEIVARMSREEAVAMGQSKAIAMVALAEATPEADTPGDLYRRGRVRIAKGREIDPRTTSARGIGRAARQLRDAGDRGKPRRGRTTTAEERDYAEALQRALRAAGLAKATVEAVATKPGARSELRIAHVPIDRVADAAKAMSKVRRSG